MLKNKILVKISGSIAAYKTSILISKLVQNNYEVKIVISKDALNFIGKATLEGLSGNEVYDDTFEDGKMMAHINLVKWADLTILVPATANTINKFACGIADNLLTSLFLAHDFSKPYIIIPAMNTNMLEHPSTQKSLTLLKSWGIHIAETNDGYLACGDLGKGKMIEPEQIFNLIESKLLFLKNNFNKKILITSGGTRENIDGIRFLTNLSTGKTASQIAQYFIDNNYDMTFLHSLDSAIPIGKFQSKIFTDFTSLNILLQNLLSENNYDLLIHNAAVSDYKASEIIYGNKKFKLPLKHKLDSSEYNIELKLSPNFKIVNKLKKYSNNQSMKLVSFKFTNSKNQNDIIKKINDLLKKSKSDLVIQNDFSMRENNIQKEFNFYNINGFIKSEGDSANIAKSIMHILNI
ncbi:MAG: bifunctional phosphopantothenoylcysteine decarboxylase/phosphopantothenate--cysteine ligase CoaBC [Ignavibacteriae bacterium]|nr:bifunctional phosphopantothenoylcysteine decarboxylase/phosphopantothenate--cysteine ligase CoaBC [Ignavibacteriota bacterium]